jgi:predicted metal-dependent hydrolase
MVRQIQLGDIAVDVVLKDIKNIHLSVYPPTGSVRISAPSRMSLDTIRVFAISKLGWIKQQQNKFREQERETPREHLDRESHYVWGQRYLLKLIEADAPPEVELKRSGMILRVRPGTGDDAKQTLLAQWYREQVRAAVTVLIAKWGPILGVKIERVFVQKMKTRWGSCNPASRSVRLNTELAKKPMSYLEYIVVHEMTHLLVRHHDDRFRALMDEHLPNWRMLRQKLNSAPLAQAGWEY